MFVCIPDAYEIQAMLPVKEVPLFHTFMLILPLLVLNSKQFQTHLREKYI